MISLRPRDENKNKYLNNVKISAQQSVLYHKSSPKVKWEANVQLMSVGSGGGCLGGLSQVTEHAEY